MSDAQHAVALTALREAPLSVDEVLAAVSDPACGGLAFFAGAVRDHDEGQGVTALAYSAHPSALDRLVEVAHLVAGRHDVIRVAAVHRVGDLAIGDLAVVVAASAVHREEAFAACRDLIDTLKSTVPIWKHQEYVGGSSDWVGLP